MSPDRTPQPTDTALKDALEKKNPDFWKMLRQRTQEATELEDFLFLSNLRKKAASQVTLQPAPRNIRIALIGGNNFHPLSDVVEHLLFFAGYSGDFFIGEFDNYVAEVRDNESPLVAFRPEVIFLVPSERTCRYTGRLSDEPELPRQQASGVSQEILELCRLAHERTHAEIVLSNFVLPRLSDPGPFRTRTLASDWSFRKLLNLELGLGAPAFVHICDSEFLANRRGLSQSRDERLWFTSKQLWSIELTIDIAHEIVRLIQFRKTVPKKVLVTDLDNTLWGGIVGEDGLDGIELGDTSAPGQAFKAFQRYLLSLSERGVLLAICSKSDGARALEPFEKHPEMILKRENIVSFKANWNPKHENIREISRELSLGLDSFVFIDDNPAEVELVRQFLPEVASMCLNSDPADYVFQLSEARFFEPLTITTEDEQRTKQYRSEEARREARESATDLRSYLESLQMKASIAEFRAVDVPRIAQLINKSNQFNLTTHRRTEAEVKNLIKNPNHACFSIRLSDRFGDHGLIAVIIAKIHAKTFEIETWLMSCRVLQRGVEEIALNEIVRLASVRKCERIVGEYIPSERNEIVKDHYSKLGFQPVADPTGRLLFEMSVASYVPRSAPIQVLQGLSV